MNNYTLSNEALAAFHTLHKYWTDTYPNTNLIISQQAKIEDANETTPVVFIGPPEDKTNKYLNDYLTDCLISPRIDPYDWNEEKLEDLLPVDKHLGLGRQFELYAEIGKRINRRKENKPLNKILADVSLLAHMEPRRILTIAERARKLHLVLGGTKAFYKLTPQVLFKLKEKDFRALRDTIEQASNGFSAFYEGDDVMLE